MQQLDYSESEVNLRGSEKAAAVLFAMGKDTAMKLAEFFSAEELRQLNEAANKLQKLNYETIDNVVKEFGENYVKHGAFAEADDLTDILGVFKSPEVEDEEDDDGDIVFGSLKLPKVEFITSFIAKEPDIIGANLLGSLPDEVAAEILTNLEGEKRNTLFKVYLERKILPEETQEQIKNNLILHIRTINKGDGSEEKIAGAAGLINCFSEETSDQLINFIETNDPSVASQIKKFIFKFSAIIKLDKTARSKLFDGVESEDISKALGGAQTDLKEAVLEVLSQRNRRLIEAEMTRGMPSPEDTEIAQKKISQLALKLAKEGKIILPSDDDEQ